MLAINPYFNATHYLNNNPDVRAAVGLGSEAAWQHYQSFGAAEGRSPNSWFDAAFYADAYPDLLDQGLGMADLLDHFHAFGAAEGRAPNGDINANTWLAYALADENQDLRVAFGIDAQASSLTPDQLKALSKHFFHWGMAEGRQAAPIDAHALPGKVFHLTPGVDNLVGTLGDDSFHAYEIDPATGRPATTLNNHDQLDGGRGYDTLYIESAGGHNQALPAHTHIRNVEAIHIHNQNPIPFHSHIQDLQGGTTGHVLNASRFEGVQVLNQIGQAAHVTGLEAGVTAAFTRVDALVAEVQAAHTAGSAHVRLDAVGAELAHVSLSGRALSDVTVSGTLADDACLLGLSLAAGEGIDTLKLNTSVNTMVAPSSGVSGQGEFSTLDASASTGNLLYGQLTDGSLSTILTGSGNDIVYPLFLPDGEALVIDAASGNDLVALWDGLAANHAFDVNLGAGDDTLLLIAVDGLGHFMREDSVVDGGTGFDTVAIESASGLGAADYRFLQQGLQNFEQIEFWEEVSTSSAIQADWLQDYVSFVFREGGIIHDVANHQAITTSGALVATSASSQGHLDVTVWNGGPVPLELTAASAQITLGQESGSAVGWARLQGTLQTASVNLDSELNVDGDILTLEQLAAMDIDTNHNPELASVVLAGAGLVGINNWEGGTLSLVDASAMQYTKLLLAEHLNMGLNYRSDNPLAETIILGEGVDHVVLSASWYRHDGKLAYDTVQNFTFIHEGGRFAADSDVLVITALKDVAAGNLIVFDASDHTSVEQALAAAAQQAGAGGAAILEYDNDTYVLVDDDTLVKLTGTFDDIDALAAALMEAATG